MIKRFLDMPNDSTSKTIMVAVILCLVCSVLVSTAAVGLKPLQEKNKLADIKVNILEVAGLMRPGADVDQLFDNIETRIIDLKNGHYVDDIDATTYDQRKAAQNPEMSTALPGDIDIARIRRQARYAKIYLVKENNRVKQVILPVHGYGLWSTMYGFIALESDGNTVYGLKFYEHGETPGLGGEIDNPKWRALWKDKQIYAQGSTPAIAVVRGHADPNSSEFKYQVDGLSGATLTSKGVENLMRFWLGSNGYGHFLENFRAENS